MKTANFKITEIKDANAEQWQIEGFASVYGNEDFGGDVVSPGAFKRTLDHKSTVPLLWNHDPGEPIGTAELTDSPAGLRFIGFLNKSVEKAQEVYALLKQKAIDGVSFGYDTVQSDWEGTKRILKELKLWEVSVVTFPMNELATVTSVKFDNKSSTEFLGLVCDTAGRMSSKFINQEFLSAAIKSLETLRSSETPAPRHVSETELAEQNRVDAEVKEALAYLQTLS